MHQGEACWIESLAGGWLFLLGLGNQRGSLIAVGETTESLLAQSRLVVEQVSGLGASACEFPAYPRILEEVCGKGWLACGTGAMAFDPLCGDGTGTALREAILASAAIRGISRGLNPSDVRAHYSLRLRAGFLRHLEQCVTFYREARSAPGGTWKSPFWSKELNGAEAGLTAAARRVTAWWTSNSSRSSRHRLPGTARFGLMVYQLTYNSPNVW